MEPPQIAVQVLGGDSAEAPQKVFDLAVAAVDRLDVQGAAALGRRLDRLPLGQRLCELSQIKPRSQGESGVGLARERKPGEP